MKIGFIGLGELGYPIAANLIDSGFDVVGYRRSSLDSFVAAGGQAGKSCADVCAQSDIIVTCLPSTDAFHEAIAGAEGVLLEARKDKLLVDLSTLPLRFKLEQRELLRAAGMDMLDCPVSGRPSVVRERQVVAFVSGDPIAVERCKCVFDGFTDRYIYLGEFGAGSKMKYIANLLVAVHVMATAEALETAARAGFPPGVVLNALGASAASSRQLHIRAPIIASGSSPVAPSASQVFYKDLRIIRDFIGSVGAVAPLFDTALTHFEQAMAQGYGGQDTSLMFTDILRHAAAQRSAPMAHVVADHL